MNIILKTFPINKNTPGAPEKAKRNGWYGASYKGSDILIIQYAKTEKTAMTKLLIAVAKSLNRG